MIAAEPIEDETFQGNSLVSHTKRVVLYLHDQGGSSNSKRNPAKVCIDKFKDWCLKKWCKWESQSVIYDISLYDA